MSIHFTYVYISTLKLSPKLREIASKNNSRVFLISVGADYFKYYVDCSSYDDLENFKKEFHKYRLADVNGNLDELLKEEKNNAR